MKKGVVYIYWGNKCDEELAISRASVEKLGLPVEAIRIEPSYGLGKKTLMYGGYK